jgi:hypothetical protein
LHNFDGIEPAKTRKKANILFHPIGVKSITGA